MATTIAKRDIGVDWIKFFAVFLIINSHSDIMYPRFSVLATGGAIGDCLFLFVSGFTLFMKRDSFPGFLDWYKRRITRIYPTVLAWLIIAGWVGYSNVMCKDMLTGGGEFVNAIMIYYVLLYFIGKYLYREIGWIYLLVAAVVVAVYVFWFPYKTEVSTRGMYGTTTYFRWLPYFAFMLLGAHLGMLREKFRFRPVWDLIALGVSFAAFYGLQFAAKNNAAVAEWQIFTLIPLLGIIYFTYKLCNCQMMRNLFEKRWIQRIVLAVGGLCLESYLVQRALITDKLNGIFPLNLFIVAIGVLILSYVVRTFGRFFLQTFRRESYDFKEIFRLV